MVPCLSELDMLESGANRMGVAVESDVTPPSPRIARFGLFQADFDQLILTRAGVRVKLQEQPFQVLEMLVRRPGELVSRDEIGRRLWSENTFVEFDDGLNTAIRKLRNALGDEPDSPRFIETVPRKGYRFIAPVDKDLPASQPATDSQAELLSVSQLQNRPVQIQVQQTTRGRIFLVSLLLVVMLCTAAAGLAAWRWRASPKISSSSPVPRLLRVTQLTRSGTVHPNQNLATDGLRLYYIDRDNGDWILKSIPALGGSATKVDVNLPRYDLQDISPDASQLLLRLLSTDEDNYSLWTMATAGGPVRRVGNIHAEAAAFSPGGKTITYAMGSQIDLCDADGRNVRPMFSVKGDVLRMRWSPLGDALRFTVNDSSLHSNSIWEIRPDGSHLRPLLPNWNLPKWEWMLGWSHDARWFAFSAVHDGGRDIWMLQHDPTSARSDRGPYQLTAGPIEFDLPVFSGEGNRLYAVGVQRRGELLRFNPSTRAFDPYLRGISADQLDFSPDGQWVAYVTYPEGVLWRARKDGSEAVKLNDTSARVLGPKWSPDGRQLAFLARMDRGAKWKAFVVPADGGLSHEVDSGTEETTGVAWTDHGKALVLSSPQFDELRKLDLESARITPVPGSTHLQGGIASPTGKFLICSPHDGTEFDVLNLKTGERRRFARDGNYPLWSADERYIYFNRFQGSKPALYRVRLTDLREEKIFDLTAFAAAGSWSTWSSVTPDGSLLLLRDLGGADVYAIDWQLN